MTKNNPDTPETSTTEQAELKWLQHYGACTMPLLAFDLDDFPSQLSHDKLRLVPIVIVSLCRLIDLHELNKETPDDEQNIAVPLGRLISMIEMTEKERPDLRGDALATLLMEGIANGSA